MIQLLARLLCCAVLALLWAFAQGQSGLVTDGPYFLTGDRLQRLTNYREWV